ncbi:DUF4432 family protein [Paenibacillus solisilvae]|uniref:DUF4432 family protein n=1 Tax=Paenibacillus solisilvae TaxID=2486751 RepID=A0ABW0W457_9BACL
MRLYGKDWTRREIEARVGRMEQIGGLRRYKLSEGLEAGTEIVEVRTGTGLRYLISPSKGLDIGLAEWKGIPISWQSPNGDVNPAYYESNGKEWLRTASGGLLMTCGLTHIGAPESTPSVQGLHGRIHHTPASQICAVTEWIEDEYCYRIAGVMEETSIFGDKLRLHRTISGRLGDSRIVIDDRVENAGFRPALHRILYHFNFGFPLLSETADIQLPAAERSAVVPGTPLEGFDSWCAPDAWVGEKVYYHRLLDEASDIRKMAEASIRNIDFPAGALTVRLRWSADTLPMLVQWKMPGACEHVLGLEPANGPFNGPGTDVASYSLEPGQAVKYKLEVSLDIVE